MNVPPSSRGLRLLALWRRGRRSGRGGNRCVLRRGRRGWGEDGRVGRDRRARSIIVGLLIVLTIQTLPKIVELRDYRVDPRLRGGGSFALCVRRCVQFLLHLIDEALDVLGFVCRVVYLHDILDCVRIGRAMRATDVDGDRRVLGRDGCGGATDQVDLQRHREGLAVRA